MCRPLQLHQTELTDQPGSGVVVAGRAARRRHNRPAALSPDEIAHENCSGTRRDAVQPPGSYALLLRRAGQSEGAVGPLRFVQVINRAGQPYFWSAPKSPAFARL